MPGLYIFSVIGLLRNAKAEQCLFLQNKRAGTFQEQEIGMNTRCQWCRSVARLVVTCIDAMREAGKSCAGATPRGAK